jgi:hypothetical protein
MHPRCNIMAYFVVRSKLNLEKICIMQQVDKSSITLKLKLIKKYNLIILINIFIKNN